MMNLYWCNYSPMVALIIGKTRKWKLNFGTAALPFYVVLSPENEELSRFHGMDPDVNKFIEFLEESLNGHKVKGI